VTLTGAITGNSLTITSGAVNGQVISFTGTPTSTTLSGTYTITVGCAGGDHGNVSAFKVPSVTGNWTGPFTPSTTVTVALTQTPGSITSPPGSGSSIIGILVYAEINTSNGQMVFTGTVNQSGDQMTGNYSVVGGSCAGNTGTGTINKT